MLDCGSFCNFISSNLVKKLNLKSQKLKNKIIIKGISGSTNSINDFVNLKFQLKILLNNKFYFIKFKENFLITNNIPIDLLFGNNFMKKYKIHYNYNKNLLYSNLNYSKFINKNSKIFDSKNFSNYSNIFKISEINNNSNNKNINSKNELSYVNSYTNCLKTIKNSPNKYSKFQKIKFQNFEKFKNSKFKNFEINFSTIKNKNSNKFKNHIINNSNKKLNNDFSYNLLIHSFLSDKENDENEIETNNDEPKIEDIPEPYRDLAYVFSKKEADKLPPHRLTDCKIVLEKDATLHYGPIYPLSAEESEVLKDYIKENLAKGIIRPSESPAG